MDFLHILLYAVVVVALNTVKFWNGLKTSVVEINYSLNASEQTDLKQQNGFNVFSTCINFKAHINLVQDFYKQLCTNLTKS